MTQAPLAVQTRGLSKHYPSKRDGDIAAVRGIDIDVEPGEIFGFLGPNGAGKSTTIKMLCTLAAPSGGSATVAGYDVVTQRDEVRRSIGLVFQESTLDGYLSAEQNLRFHAELYGVSRTVVAQRMSEVLAMVGLTERRTSLVRTFSGGMKRRLEIARGLLHSPRVLFLDEPTIGLDPQTRSSIWAYVGELKRRDDITIFLTTHYMDEAEYCDRIAIIDDGRIIVVDTPEALKATVGKDQVRLRTADDEAAVAELAEQLDVQAQRRDGVVTFAVERAEEFLPRLFAGLSVAIESVNVSRPSLDDVFMSFTGSTIRDSEAASNDWMAMVARR